MLGSGLTIAGATYCLSFARLPWFNTMGAPVAIGMLVVVVAGLTLGPAVVFVGSRFGLFEKKGRPAAGCGGGSAPRSCVGPHRFWP